MFNLSLTACSFYLQKLNSKGADILNLNSDIECETPQGTKKLDVENLFANCFTLYKNGIDDDINQKTFECSELLFGETAEFSYGYTIIKSGAYGSASDIIDKESRKIVHRKTESQADAKQFYLYIVLPKNNADVIVQKGLLFFQNTGSYGVKTITTGLVRKFFSSQYKIAFKCRNISPELFVKKNITQQNLQKLTMIKNIKSGDIADNLNIGYGVETRTLSRLYFKTENAWNELITSIKHYSKGKHYLFEFNDYEYDKLKVTVDIGGRERIIDTHYLENMSIIELIPSEIKMANGLPNEKKLLDHFQTVATEYLSELALHNLKE